jgi:hypothetical protein
LWDRRKPADVFVSKLRSTQATQYGDAAKVDVANSHYNDKQTEGHSTCRETDVSRAIAPVANSDLRLLDEYRATTEALLGALTAFQSRSKPGKAHTP